jgi:hypothetical protein
LERISCGYLPYRRKEFIRQSQPNYFVHFIEAIITGRSWLVRPLPNAGPKSPNVPAKSRHTRVRDGILLERRNKLVVDGFFRETLELQKKCSTPLFHSVHSDDLKDLDLFHFVFNLFFQGFVHIVV